MKKMLTQVFCALITLLTTTLFFADTAGLSLPSAPLSSPHLQTVLEEILNNPASYTGDEVSAAQMLLAQLRYGDYIARAPRDSIVIPDSKVLPGYELPRDVQLREIYAQDITVSGTLIANNLVITGSGSTSNQYVLKAGDTMTGNLTMANQSAVRFGDTTTGNFVSVQAPGTVPSSYFTNLPAAQGANQTTLVNDGSGNLEWLTALLQGGNTAGTDLTFGTNDNFDVNIIAAGNTALSINTSGTVSIPGNLVVSGSLNAPFIATNINIIPEIVSVQKGPLYNASEFNSIKAAVDSITDASVTKPYVVRVAPGLYIEDTITLKPFVSVIGEESVSCNVMAASTAQDIIVGAPNSNLYNLYLFGATDTGSAAIRFTGGGLFRVFSCGFGSNDILFYQTSDVPVIPSVVLFQNCSISSDAQFTAGISATRTNAFLALDVDTFLYQVSAPNFLIQDFISFSGSNTLFFAQNILAGTLSLFSTTTTYNAFNISDGAQVRINNSSIGGFGRGFYIPNTGAAPQLNLAGVFTSDNLYDILIERDMTVGSISGQFDRNKISIPAANTAISLLFLDPNVASVTMRGPVYTGQTIDAITNISPLIEQGADVGLLTGGELNEAGGLVITVSLGDGYLMVGTPPTDVLKYITWPTQNVVLTASASQYIYVDQNGVIQTALSAPALLTTILLGKTETSSTGVLFVQNISQQGAHTANLLDKASRTAFGNIYVTGSIVTATLTTQLAVTSGQYFFGTHEYLPSGGTPIAWDAYYHDAVTTFTVVSQSNVDYQQYDNGMGLSVIPVGEYAKHELFVVGEGSDEAYLLVYSQTIFATLTEAQQGNLPVQPASWSGNICPIASIIVSNTTTPSEQIPEILDERPRIGFSASSVAGVTVHGNLLGLLADDHPQYLLDNGTRAMSGNLNLGTNAIVNVSTVNSVVVENHHARHGANSSQDPLDTAAAVEITDSTNGLGSSNSFARADHLHAHGNRGGGTLHSAATTVSAGFMSAQDKTSLDNLVSGTGAFVLKSGDSMTGGLIISPTFSTTALAVNPFAGNTAISIANGGSLGLDIAGGGAQIAGNVNLLAESQLRLQDSGGGEYVALKAPATVTASYVLNLPPAQGTAGQRLAQSSTPGILEWVNAATGTVTAVTATLPIISSGGSAPNISIQDASLTTSGAVTVSAQTFGGAKTFNNPITIAAHQNQLVFQTGGSPATIHVVPQSTNTTYIIPDAMATASFVMTEGSQTINGPTVFTSPVTVPNGTPLNPGLRFDGLSNAGLSVQTTNTLVISTNGANRLQISGNGEVTIANLGGSGSLPVRTDNNGLLSAGQIVNADVSNSAAIAYSKLAALTPNEVLVSNVSGAVSASSVSTTELNYLSGVVSPLQAQIDAKVAKAGDTMSGNLLFTNNLGIDTSGMDVLNIGVTNANIINIGTAITTQTINIGTEAGITELNFGSTSDIFNINGAVTNINTTELNISDPLITLNTAGGTSSGTNSGMEIKENNVVTGYVQTSGDRASWMVKAPATAGVVTITPGASGFTLDQGSHDPVTLTTIGAAPNANAATLTGQQLQLQPADATFGGVVTTAAQTLAGDKTFANNVIVSGTTTAAAGSAAYPSVNFAGSAQTGLSAATTNQLVLSTAGTARVTIAPAGTVAINNLSTGVVHSDVSGNLSSSLIVDADITSATISNSKLAAISSSNIPNTIVVRDTTGSFTANIITATFVGNFSGTVTGTASNAILSTSFSGSLLGDVTGTQLTTSVAFVGGKTAPQVATAVTTVQAATDINTPNTLVLRDSNGDFATRIMTGTATYAQVAGSTLITTSFIGTLLGDVTGTQLTTSVAVVGGKTASEVATAVNTVQTATNVNTANTLVLRDASGDFATRIMTGTATYAQQAGSAITSTSFGGALQGDVTGLQLTTSVAAVGGKTATEVATAVSIVQSATSNNVPSTLVFRDVNGNFAANIITATFVGNFTGTVTGTASNAILSTSFSGNLLGDVTGTQLTTSVAVVGGKTALEVATAVTTVQAATDANTPNTLVLRDVNGDFATRIMTGTATYAQQAGSSVTTTSFGGSLLGDVTGTQLTTSVALVGGKTSSEVATAVTAVQNATELNTPNTLVLRDNNGDFATRIMTGTATYAQQAGSAGTAINFSGSLAGDVSGTQLATVVDTVGGKTASEIATAVSTVQSATSNNVPSTLVLRDASGNFAANIITATVTNATNAASFTGSLSGDVTGTQGNTVVASVGGQTASYIVAGAVLANNATATNSANEIVKRDGLGNFIAGTITANLIGSVTGNLFGTATNATNAVTAVNFSGSLSGDVTGNQNSTQVQTVGGQTAANVAAATVLANAATSSNTAGAIVRRDGSGNFTASIVTATFVGNLTGNVTGDVTGNLFGNATTATSATTAGSATNFTGPLVGDVTGNQGATVVSFVGGVSAANIAAGASLVNTATSNNIANTPVLRDASGNFAASIITATATNATTAVNFSGALLGDVTGNQSATVVSTVGGLSAASVASGAALANNATSTNSFNQIVRRDGAGNFSASLITANLTGNVTGNLTGNATTATTAGSATNFTGPLVGDVTGNQGATVVSLVGGQTAANVAAATVLANAANSANTPNAIVRRNGTGGFSAGIITATFVGNVTGNVTGNLTGNADTATTALTANSATNFTGSLVGDVSGTQGATVVNTVGGQSAMSIAATVTIVASATNNDTANSLVWRDGLGNFATNMITLDGAVVNPTDAATKDYVDAAVSSGFTVHDPVIVTSISNIVIVGTQTIDGVALNVNDRVLLTGQTVPVQNGIWLVQVGAWTRPTDFASGDVAGATYVLTTSGTTLVGTSWVCTTPAAIIDTDPIFFAQFSLAGQTTAANVGAGAGQIFRDKIGNTLNLKTLAAGQHVVVTNNTNDITLSTDATDANVISTLVARDINGNFSAGTITAALTGAASLNVLKAGDVMTGNLTMTNQAALRLADSLGNYVGLRAPNSVSASYTVDVPATAPSVGQVLQAASVNALQWVTSGGVPATVRKFYVAKNGNDTNDGSFNTPFLTIAHAISVANGIASLTNPVVISIGAGVFVENNSGGPLAITASGISLVGNSITGTIVIPVAPSNHLFSASTSNVTFLQMTLTTNPGFGASTASAISLTAGAGNGGFQSIIVSGFQTGLSFASTGTTPLIVVADSIFLGNGTAVLTNNVRLVIETCPILGDAAGIAPVNTGIAATGVTALVTCIGNSIRLCATGIAIDGGANVRILSNNFERTTRGVVATGGSNTVVIGSNFIINDPASVNVDVFGANTVLKLNGTNFEGRDESSQPQGIAIRGMQQATVLIDACSIANAMTAIQCGTTGDTSTTVVNAVSVGLENCVTDIVQVGTSTLSFFGGTFEQAKLNIEDADNVGFAAFNSTAGSLALGTGEDETISLYQVRNGQAILPELTYEPNYYGNKGTVYKNENTNPTFNATQSQADDASYYVITGDRTHSASLHLMSDSGAFGVDDNTRGWHLIKTGTAADLLFSYSNSDNVSQALRGQNTVMSLNGFDNQVEFPLATNTPLPANTVAKLVWATDTNLYRASASLLKTDGNFAVGALNTTGVVHNDVSGNLSTSLIVDADVSPTANIADTKLATISTPGKVANSATTATSANIPNTIVARDSNGDFFSRIITASLTGAASLNVLKAGDVMTGNLTMTNQSEIHFGDTTGNYVGLRGPTVVPSSYTVALPSTAPTAGQVLQAASTNALQWITSGGIPATARKYYVAKNGNDANDGSFNAPFLTIAQAVTAANSIASVANPVVIFVGAGTFVENNSGGPIAITASGITIAGSSITGTLVIPNTPSNHLFSATTSNITFLQMTLTTNPGFGASTASALNLTAGAGNGGFQSLIVSGFQTGFSFNGLGTVPLLIVADIIMLGNGTAITINNARAIVETTAFLGATSGSTPANMSLSATGTNALVTFLGNSIRLTATGVFATGGANVRIVGGNFETTDTSILCNGASATAVVGSNFMINNANSINVAATGAGTTVTINGCNFDGRDAAGVVRGIGLQSTNAASIIADACTISNATVAIQCGTSGDTSSTEMRANSNTLVNCTTDVQQVGSSALRFVGGVFENSKISIANPTNVTFSAFDRAAGESLTIGNDSDQTQILYQVLNGQAMLPNLTYEPNYYGNKGPVYKDSSTTSVVSALQSTSFDANYYVVTGDRTKQTSLNLISDTGNFGIGDNVRGWSVIKTGTQADLRFTYSNNDTSGLAARSANTLMTLNGFDNQLEFPLAGGTNPPTNTVARLIWATDTNLYRASAGTLKTDGNFAVGGLNTAGVVHNSAAGLLSTSLIVNADVDPAAAIVDTKLATISTAGKVSNSATTATALNTPSTIVLRDGSGNFAANIITATFVGNFSGTVTGTASNAILSTSFSGNLLGDVTGTQLTTSVAAVGGKTAAQIASTVNAVTAATSSNTPNTLVLRDGTGTFAGSLTGAASLNVLKAGDTMTGTLNLNSVSGNSLIVSGSTQLNNGSVTIGTLNTAGVVHNSSVGLLSTSLIVNADVSASAAIVDTKLATISTAGKVANSATTATAVNTPSTIVLRDGSGNFAANIITATFVGNFTGIVTGTASNAILSTSFSGNLLGDVTGTQLTTSVAAVGGKTATQVATAVTAVQAATSANTPSTLVLRDGSGNFSAGTITANLIGNVTGAASLNVLKTGDTMTGTLNLNSTSGNSLIVSGSTQLNNGSVTIGTFNTAGVVHNSSAGLLSTSQIVNADVSASAAIDYSKLAALTVNRVLVSDGSGFVSVSPVTSSQILTLSTVSSNIQDQINSKVSRSGDTMTGALTLPAGAAATPSINFTGSPTTGLSAATANNLVLSTNAAGRLSIDASGATTIAAPTVGTALTVNGGPATAVVVTPGTNQAGITVTGNGTSSAVQLTQATTANAGSALLIQGSTQASNPAVTITQGGTATAQSGLAVNGGSNTTAPLVALTSGSAAAGATLNVTSALGSGNAATLAGNASAPTVSVTSNAAQNAIVTSLGIATTPAYSFIGDANTGMYSPTADQLGFTTGGTLRLTITNGGVIVASLASGSILPVKADTSGALIKAAIVDSDVAAGANINANKIGTGAVSTTVFNYLQNVTSDIQTQLNAKVASVSVTAPITNSGTATAPVIGITDAGAAQSGAVTAGTQTFGGAKTFNTAVSISTVSNQLVLNSSGNSATINASGQSAARIYTIPEVGANANFVMTEGTQTINGTKTFTSETTFPDGTAAAPSINFASSMTTGLSAQTANTLVLSTNANGRMTLDANGGVTIAAPTTATTTALQVNAASNAPAEYTIAPNARIPQTLSNSTATGNVTVGATPTAVVTQGNYAYVIDATPQLKVIDISNPASPTQVGSVATQATPQGIAVQNNYVFVVNNSGTQRLEIFDVSAPASPTSVGTLAITGGIRVQVQNRYAYVLTSGNNIVVVDISAPASPATISTFATAQTNVRAMDVQGNFLYVVANNAGTAGASASIKPFNIANPFLLVAGTATTIGTANNTLVDIKIQGNLAFTLDAFANTLRIYNLFTGLSTAGVVSAPLLVNTAFALGGTNTTPVSLDVQGQYVYIVNSGGTQALRIIDVSNPGAPAASGTVTLTSALPTAVAVQNNYAFVLNSTTPRLSIFANSTLVALKEGVKIQGGTPGLTIDDGNGNFGTALLGDRCVINGTLRLPNIVTSLLSISDKRVKQNITPIDPEESLAKITTLEPQTYEYTQEWKEHNAVGDKVQRGFIAQDMQRVFPDLVTETPKVELQDQTLENVLSIAPTGILADLVGSIKALDAKVKKQSALIEDLLNRIEEQAAQLCRCPKMHTA